MTHLWPPLSTNLTPLSSSIFQVIQDIAYSSKAEPLPAQEKKRGVGGGKVHVKDQDQCVHAKLSPALNWELQWHYVLTHNDLLIMGDTAWISIYIYKAFRPWRTAAVAWCEWLECWHLDSHPCSLNKTNYVQEITVETDNLFCSLGISWFYSNADELLIIISKIRNENNINGNSNTNPCLCFGHPQ